MKHFLSGDTILRLTHAAEVLQSNKVQLDRAAFLATGLRAHNVIADALSAIEYLVKHGPEGFSE
jgi:hypothetical protein